MQNLPLTVFLYLEGRGNIYIFLLTFKSYMCNILFETITYYIFLILNPTCVVFVLKPIDTRDLEQMNGGRYEV